jgi:uncharacterized damage-inducible protein DinB
MLEMIRDLVAHKAYGDRAMLASIQQDPIAAADAQILELIHHVLLANRFWIQTITQGSFALEEESRPFASFEDALQRYSSTQQQEAGWLSSASERDLTREIENPMIPGGKCSVAQALLQVCLHSHAHRAQCAKLLRTHGIAPPMTDFILWLGSRSAPATR